MAAYRNAVLRISTRFEGLEFHHVSRDNNQAADVLARMGAKRDPIPKNTFLVRLFKPFVVWQGGDNGTSINDPSQIAPSQKLNQMIILSEAPHLKNHPRPMRSWP